MSATCREGCGACCIAPSITSALPGMPQGKPAGVPCIQLDGALRCKVFGQPQRPVFCGGLQPSAEMCGTSPEEAMDWLTRLEQATQPVKSRPMHATSPSVEFTSASPCIGHCTTVLGDDVCRSCLRTFEEVAGWLEMDEEERRAVNRRIAMLTNKLSGSQGNS